MGEDTSLIWTEQRAANLNGCLNLCRKLAEDMGETAELSRLEGHALQLLSMSRERRSIKPELYNRCAAFCEDAAGQCKNRLSAGQWQSPARMFLIYADMFRATAVIEQQATASGAGQAIFEDLSGKEG